ncbi:MAG: ATP-binding cassette domain-containing protein [Desulfobacterales bacterium]|nr:ATP-binding cassette domain-containing protein [Desulfobacterales bacterium]
MRVEVHDIHKHYGPVRANDGITLTIEPGRIHGILGENGAGKTTLMKILAGYTRKTSGYLCMDQVPVDYRTPTEASQLGIGMLYQDPLDFPFLSVLENFMIGQAVGLANQKKYYRKKFDSLAADFDFALRPNVQVNRLTIGERQQLEILRLLSLGIQVLILDEPTTGITNVQKDYLFSALKKMTSEGKSIILVSHKLKDVEAVCNQLTVLRRGKVTGEMKAPFDTDILLEMMFGQTPIPFNRCLQESGRTILELDNVSAPGGRSGLSDCNIRIRQGEVVGLAGLEGSGQDVFLRIAAGLLRPAGGSVMLKDKRMNAKDYHCFKHSGVFFQPSSRLEEGLISGCSVTEHFALQSDHKKFVTKWSDATSDAKKKMTEFRIIGRPDSLAESLSGGNQQRLLLSFLPRNPLLLLLENPTRGLDMESSSWVWQHLHKYCSDNTTIVFSSSDLDEIIMAADRVLVFFNGKMIKDTRTCETSSYELGLAIAGKR